MTKFAFDREVQRSTCIISKGEKGTEFDRLKDNQQCFPKLQASQNKLFLKLGIEKRLDKI